MATRRSYYRGRVNYYGGRARSYARGRASRAYGYAKGNKGKIFGLSTTFVVGAAAGYFGLSRAIPYSVKLALAVNPVRFKMSGMLKSVASGMLAGEILRVYFPQFSGMLGNLGQNTNTGGTGIPTY